MTEICLKQNTSKAKKLHLTNQRTGKDELKKSKVYVKDGDKVKLVRFGVGQRQREDNEN